jgi:hypothetical protein
MSENFKRYLNMYEWETTLPGSGKKIKYKPITTGQIKRLLLYNEVYDENVVENALDELISECVVTEGFNVKDLYLQDRFFLMVEIRCVTKGYKYMFPSKCSKCNSQTQQTIDLSKLPVKPLIKDENIVEQVVKPMTDKKGRLIVVDDKKSENKVKQVEEKKPWNYIKINDNLAITMKILTRSMQEKIYELLKDKKLNEIETQIESGMYGYAIVIENIITPDGAESDLTFEDKLYFIENLTPNEKDKIDEWLEKNTFGLDFKFKVKCVHCGDEAEKVIPLNDFFY